MIKKGCPTCLSTHTVRVSLPSDYTVTSISLQDQPGNGSIKQLSQNVFDYTKNSKFLGTDRFTVKVCGKKSYGTSACAVVAAGESAQRERLGVCESDIRRKDPETIVLPSPTSVAAACTNEGTTVPVIDCTGIGCSPIS